MPPLLSDEQIKSLNVPDRRRYLEVLQRCGQEMKTAPWRWYEPSPPQLKFHKSQKQFRVLAGGNRSGKTHGGLQEVCLAAVGEHPWRGFPPPPLTIWASAINSPKARDTMIPRLRETLGPTAQWNEHYMRFILENGSMIWIKSDDAGRKSYESASVDIVWMDEEHREEIFNECKVRLLDCGGCLFITVTPLEVLRGSAKYLWLHKKYLQWEVDPDGSAWDFIELPLDSNPIIDKSRIDDILSEYDEDERIVRRLGKFGATRGLAIPLARERHVIDPIELDDSWTRYRILDPGYDHPCAVVWAVASEDTLYITHCYNERGKSVPEVAEYIKTFETAMVDDESDFSDRPADFSFMDPAGWHCTQAAPQNVADQFAEEGVYFGRANNRVQHGYLRLVKLFKSDKVKIFDTPANQVLIRQLQTYRWGQRDEDDLVDCMRYLAVENPRYHPRKARHFRRSMGNPITAV